jgi:hypothetical protein
MLMVKYDWIRLVKQKLVKHVCWAWLIRLAALP